MTAAPPRTAVVPAPRPAALPPSPGRSTPATQQQRRLRYQATLAGIRARATVTPAGSAARLQVCGAANLLTALGVRVDVVRPATPWPRGRLHRLLVENSAGALGDLALLVGVPRTAGGWTDVADRVLPVRTAARTTLRDVTDAVVCPVAIAYRSAAGPMLVPPRTLNDVVRLRDLVIEVRLLPARERTACPSAPSGHVRPVPGVALRRVRDSWHRRDARGPAPTIADRRPVLPCERSPAAPRPSP